MVRNLRTEGSLVGRDVGDDQPSEAKLPFWPFSDEASSPTGPHDPTFPLFTRRTLGPDEGAKASWLV
jgi:hypothetical protein